MLDRPFRFVFAPLKPKENHEEDEEHNQLILPKKKHSRENRNVSGNTYFLWSGPDAQTAAVVQAGTEAVRHESAASGHIRDDVRP